MSLERGKTVHHAYQKGSPHGKFNSLYGTGDHPSEGGKIVDGVDGKIRIMAGVESDIMKAHPKEGEYILMQKKGYDSFADVPVSEDGYRRYGGPNPGAWGKIGSWLDKNIVDPIQQGLSIGEYDPENIATKNVEKRLGGFLEQGFENLQAGTDKMVGKGGFIQEQLGEQLYQFGVKKEMLDTQTTGVQQSMGQYAGVRDQQKKTGLTTDTSSTVGKIETQGEMAMQNIGSQGKMIEGQESAAITQAEIDEYKFTTQTSTAMAKMMSDYMNATGEDVPEEFYTLFQDYSEEYS